MRGALTYNSDGSNWRGAPTDTSNQRAISDNFLAKKGHWVTDGEKGGHWV